MLSDPVNDSSWTTGTWSQRVSHPTLKGTFHSQTPVRRTLHCVPGVHQWSHIKTAWVIQFLKTWEGNPLKAVGVSSTKHHQGTVPIHVPVPEYDQYWLGKTLSCKTFNKRLQCTKPCFWRGDTFANMRKGCVLGERPLHVSLKRKKYSQRGIAKLYVA